jgi:hypothetical protein
MAVWKWPPVWPYDPELFKIKEEIVEAPANPMAGLMGGMTPTLPEAPTEEKEPLDALTHTGEKKRQMNLPILIQKLQKNSEGKCPMK